MSDRHGDAPGLSSSLAGFLAEDPETWTFRRLWRRMPLPLRHEAAAVTLAASDEPGLRAALLGELAAAGGFRPQTVANMEPQEAARLVGKVPSRRLRHAGAILRLFLTRARRELLAAYLDRVGVPHEGGVVQDGYEGTVEAEAARAAAAELLERFDPDDVAVYLAVLTLQNPNLAAGLGAWLGEGTGVGHERDADADPETREPELVREARLAVPDEGAVPGSTFTALDRTLIRAAVDAAQGVQGAPDHATMEDMVEEVLSLSSARHASFFHRGFLDALTDQPYRETLAAENESRRGWYLAGWFSGLGRRNRHENMVQVFDSSPHMDTLQGPGGGPWVALALPLLFEALCRTGREPEGVRLLTPEFLLQNPTLLPDLLREGTRLLRDDDAERARPLFDRLGEVVERLEAEGEPVREGFFLEVRRRRAHCYRQLGEAERARELLERLLDEEADRDIRAMVLADLGLLDGGLRSLAEVRLWRSESERRDLLEALERGRPRFDEALGTESRFVSHGAWPLAIRAMAREDWETARKLLSEVVSSFVERPDRYGQNRLLARVKVAAGIAEALVMDYTRLGRARDLLVAGLSEGARIPGPFLPEVLAALEAHEDDLAGEVLTRVLEREGPGVLAELGDSDAVRRTPAVATHLLAHAREDGVKAAERARAFRRALPILLSEHPIRLDEARQALDQLEGLAREGVGSDELLALLAEPEKVEPAWPRDEAAWARIGILEARDRLDDAVVALRERLSAILAAEEWNAEEEAAAVVSRARSYGLDREWIQDLEDRFEAWRREFGEEGQGTLPPAHPRQPYRILIVGGDERQHELAERVKARLEAEGDAIRVEHLPTGWSGNWSKTLDDAVTAAGRADAVVLLRYMRTEFGRSLRAELECPWVSCPGVGILQVARMVRKAAVFAARQRGG